MARSFWFRLLGRDGDLGSQRIFDLVREADAGEIGIGGRLFQHLVRQARSETPAAALDPRAVDAPAATVADLLNVLPAFVFAIGPVAAPPAPEETAAAPGPDNLIGMTDRVGTVQFGTMEPLRVNGTPLAPFDGNGFANYVVAYSDDFQSSLVYDATSMTLLTGGAGDWPALGAGSDDTLELSGDFSAGFTLPGQPAGIDIVVVRPGNDYNLVTNDDHVAPGETMTIDAMPLGAGDHIMFDGSAETDGRFEFFGSGSDDFFFGGGGDDRILGMGGGDSLSGGGGSDIFVYASARESSGADYDTIADFDPGADRIDLPGAVAGFGDAIEGGTLSTATFNDDLAAVLGNLGSAQAVWFAPDAGDLAGQIFLIVDGNGQPGYQQGEDYVFAVAGTPLADLTGQTDIFI